MQQDIIYYANKRYTCKAYDKNKKISQEDMQKIKELLQLSPSSTNAQPWHFVIASTDEAKKRVAKSTAGNFVFNANSVKDASHVVVFCGKTDIDEKYLLEVLQKEERDGRFLDNVEFKDAMHKGRSFFIKYNKETLNNLPNWIAKQVYINLGNFLLGLSALGIDATPMEGFDSQILDAEFGLKEKGLTSLIVVPIGYANKEKDYNHSIPKSRLDISSIITEY